MTADLQDMMNALMKTAIQPNWDAIKRITADGDVAIICHDVVPEARQLVALLRGSQREPVVRLTRTRARRVFERAEQDLRTWATTRTPGQKKIILAARNALIRVNHTVERGFWHEAPEGASEPLRTLLRP